MSNKESEATVETCSQHRSIGEVVQSLYFFARSLGIQHSDAEDLVQAAILDAIKKGHVAADGVHTPALLFWKLKLRNIDEWRSKGRRDRKWQQKAADHLARRRCRPSPNDDAEHRELQAATRECIENLPPRQRQALGHRLEGLENPEIAVKLDTTKQAVKNLLHQARRNVRQCLQKKGFEMDEP